MYQEKLAAGFDWLEETQTEKNSYEWARDWKQEKTRRCKDDIQSTDAKLWGRTK